MSTSRILGLGAVALLLYVCFSYGLRSAFPRIKVSTDTALAGRVTGDFQSTGRRTFFLNGQQAPRYDFDTYAWVPAAGPRAGQQPEGALLSHYLRKGDLVRKPSQAAVLTVQRGDSLTRWVCTP